MSKRKLLLADDSITIQKVVNLTFADEGIEVISVGDGDSAMQKFDEVTPDLVMADVNMPGLTGYEICQIIKQNDDTRHIPVILLVGSFEPFDEAEAARVGADDFLTKPFQSIRQLVNKVNDLLSRSETVSEEPPSGETETAPPVDAFADTLQFESKEEPPTEFGDSGMDDEMIETSPVNAFVSGASSGSQIETTADYAKTQPLNAEDLKGFSIISANEDVEQELEEASQDTEPETVEEGFEDSETTSATTEAETAVEEPFVEETETPEEFVSEEESEKVTDSEPELDYYAPITEEAESSEPESAETETIESESEVSEETETSAVDESESQDTEESEISAADESEPVEANISETDLTVTEETEVPETDSAQEETQVFEIENAPSLSFDDGDLLELPPLVEETGIRPQTQVQQFISEPETETEVWETEDAETETEVAESETTAEIEKMKSFPPELIEAIARKVAERISDKVIRDIAWEIVPQMTELIVKQMAEEKLKE